MYFGSIWDVLMKLTPEEKFWMLAWFLFGIIPFIYAAIRIKKKIKVGSIDFSNFALMYIVFLVALYAFLDFRIGTEPTIIFFSNASGFLVGFILMIGIFNSISKGIREAYLIEIQLEKHNVNVDMCFTYEEKGHLAVIQLDKFGHESIWNLLKRIFGKRRYLFCEGAKFDWTEHNVNIAYLCTEWSRFKEWLIIDGKKKYCDILEVIPVPATEFSPLEFLINFQKWNEKDMQLANLYKIKLQMERDIFDIAVELFQEWVELTDKGHYADARASLRTILKRYQYVQKKPQAAEETDSTKKKAAKEKTSIEPEQVALESTQEEEV